MNTPRGWNPVGEHAPGLPDHTQPIPGHRSGGPGANIGDGIDPPRPENGGFNTKMTGPGIPLWMAKPIAKLFMYMLMAVLAPMMACLYPIAGVAGVTGGAVGYLLARMLGGGYDMTHNWAWIGCAVGVIALMRRETTYADTHPAYVAIRHSVRLALSFIFFMYFNMTDQGNGFFVAMIVSGITVVILHFVLRAKLLRFTWNAMLWSAGLRPLGVGDSQQFIDGLRKDYQGK